MTPGDREGPQPEQAEEHEGLMAWHEGGEGVPAKQPADMLLHQDTPPSEGHALAEGIVWTFPLICKTIGLFLVAGLAEIGGGWLVWQCLREKKPWYFFVTGSVVLVLYGIIPTFQPEGVGFARVYAVYGGVFILLSYGWGWILDGSRPDLGDAVGSIVAVLGVALAWFWPRTGNNSEDPA
ncbi:hypothetical protein DUNSADRAFT_547 [Dunaliella salina]|uniref:Uncharacterized protein n=1 Tax=Dunaliella salina TaxID=3046 RepID=A0ABQ7FYV9_DUNSA|nr:hypothetical protein DUNSADRAFT_547 [Dunaliella salina]|eukprot:KAF5827509.1 hypothetical protein DUNSADRAFT_547 [Dunaliella salina]